jgi:hypothetical protein
VQTNNPTVSATEAMANAQGAWLRISPALAATLGDTAVYIKY